MQVNKCGPAAAQLARLLANHGQTLMRGHRGVRWSESHRHCTFSGQLLGTSQIASLQRGRAKRDVAMKRRTGAYNTPDYIICPPRKKKEDQQPILSVGCTCMATVELQMHSYPGPSSCSTQMMSPYSQPDLNKHCDSLTWVSRKRFCDFSRWASAESKGLGNTPNLCP